MSVSKLLSSCKKRWELYISLEMMQCSSVRKIQDNSVNKHIAEREEKQLYGKMLICKALWAAFSASIVQTRCSANLTKPSIATSRGNERLMALTTKYQAQFALVKPAACFQEESITPGDCSVSFSMGVLIHAGTLTYQNTSMNTTCKHSLYRFIVRLCVCGRVWAHSYFTVIVTATLSDCLNYY